MRQRIVAAALLVALLVTLTPSAPRVWAQLTQPRDPRVVALIDGDSAARRQALDALETDQKLVLDPTLLAALKEAATDRDPAFTRDLTSFVGGRFIWNAKPQNPAAIALMCELATHPDRDTRYNAVYYGLSTVRPQTDATIAAMFAAGAMDNDYDSNLHGRIAWGLKATPPVKIAPACERYWTDEYVAEKPKSAYVVYQTYKEATGGREPPKPERFAAIKAKIDELVAQRKAEHAKLMPELDRELREGDSKRRTAVMQKIYTTPYLLFDLDDSLIDAFTVAADDPEWRVRWEVARLTGNRWIWVAEKQHPKAIALALKLRQDPHASVRHFAIYFGLSTVRDPSDEVIRAQLDSAIVEAYGSSVGRVAWGLRGVPADRLVPLFQPYFDRGGQEAKRAAALFAEITGTAPPGEAVRATLTTKPAAAATSQSAYEATFNALYEHLGQVYPAFEIKKIDWKKVGDELLPRAKDVKNGRDFGLLCLQLVARLEDSHAQLLPGTAQIPTIDFPQFDPGFACLIDDRDRPVIYHVDNNSPAQQAGVKVGMTVVSVNGKPAADAIKAWMDHARKYVGYSSDRYLRYDAAKGFHRTMKRGEVVKVEMEQLDGAKKTFEMPATLGGRYVPRLPVPIDGIRDDGGVMATRLDDNVGYIYVRRIRGDLPGDLDTALTQLGEIDGLIIDVRGNSGGGFDAARSFRNFDPNDKEEPDRPRYTRPIALLIDERCISAGEGWASWFIANKRARVFGTATAGASSRKQEYTLTNGLYKVIVPVKAYTGSLDRPIERRGLEPDVPVRVTAPDVAAGKDAVLETAKTWLREEAKQ